MTEGGAHHVIEPDHIISASYEGVGTTGPDPPGGTPGWNLLNLRFGHSIQSLTINLGLQNLFDEAYRLYTSGVDGYARSL